MKKFLSILLCCVLGVAFAFDLTRDEAQQAVKGALDQAEVALKKAPFGTKTVAILPLPGDRDGRLIGYLKNILTRNGFVCVEGKEDPMWDEIIKEIAWDERKADILDPATIVKFGQLKAAQILLYGKVQTFDCNNERIFVELELHAVDLATKQHIWGDNFAYRFYFGKNVKGIVSLDSDLRLFLKKGFAQAEASLRSPDYTEDLKGIQTVTVVPLAGDVDQYLTGLTISMLTRNHFQPKNQQITSLAQMRMLGRSGQLDSDAICYGAVRDLQITDPVEKVNGSRVTSTRTVSIDFVLYIETAKEGKTKWSSDHITLTEELTAERAATAAERDQYRQEKFDAIPGNIKEDVVDNWKTYAGILGGIIGAIVLVVLIIFGIKLYISYHNVR